jgi:hypothetical protein
MRLVFQALGENISLVSASHIRPLLSWASKNIILQASFIVFHRYFFKQENIVDMDFYC